MDNLNIVSLGNYEAVKDNLFIRVMSRDLKKEFLKDKPYRKVADLAIVPYISISKNECAAVTNGLMNSYGITKNELMEQAIKNSERIYPRKCITLSGAIAERQGNNVENASSDNVYVITNSEMVYGASALFYKNTLKDIATMFDGNDFWIVPSSIHEVLVTKSDTIDPESLHSLVKTVNATCVSDNDTLSENPLLYSAKTGTLTLWNKVETH